MATRTTKQAETRIPLSRERVLSAAIDIADQEGIKSLTMRRLAESLEVEAMSLYYHVPNKDAIFDGVIEAIVNEILDAAEKASAPDPGDDWKGALKSRILAARKVIMRHRWAPEVFESRTEVGLSVMIYFNSMLEIMRAGGFSYDLAHHAIHTLGSRALGFSQELFEPDDGDESSGEAESEMDAMADRFPYLVEMLSEISHDGPEDTVGWCDDETEFNFAIDLLLDGLEAKLAGT